jgi:hypothetical protein
LIRFLEHEDFPLRKLIQKEKPVKKMAKSYSEALCPHFQIVVDMFVSYLLEQSCMYYMRNVGKIVEDEP